jgi:hypothetical protein
VEAEAADHLEDRHRHIAYRARGGTVGRDDAQERDRGTQRYLLPVKEAGQCRQVRRRYQSIAVGIGSGTADYGSPVDVRNVVAVTVVELVSQMAQVVDRHQTVAVGVPRK